MPIKRYWLQFAVFLSAVGLALIAAFLVEQACRALWLPGETRYAFWHIASRALANLLHPNSIEAAYCASDGLMARLNAALPWVWPALLVLAGAQVAYELFRNAAWRRFMVAQGNHNIILGEPDEIPRLVDGAGARSRTLLLAPLQGQGALARRYWRNITASAQMPAARLGLGRAARIYAVSGSDFRNRDLALAARHAGSADVILRIESTALRAAQSHAGGLNMEEFSLTQGLIRDGAARGDPGPLFARAQYPAHIVLCGGGRGLDELALHLAGFGYGLEVALPRFTIIQMDGRLSPALDRLSRLKEVVDLSLLRIDRDDVNGLEGALLSALSGPVRPAAIHCIDEGQGEAAAAAMIAVKASAALGVAEAKVIAYGEKVTEAPGVVTVQPDDLFEAIGRKSQRDRMARAVHENYLDLQRRTLGPDFGRQDAEQPWERLAMAYRDDNRAVADHIDHMLSAMGLRRRPRTGAPAELNATEIERMAQMAHARWFAARALKGWRYGQERDNRLLLHPSMVSYDALSEAEKEKDRDQIRAIPHILLVIDEEIGRLVPESGK